MDPEAGVTRDRGVDVSLDLLCKASLQGPLISNLSSSDFRHETFEPFAQRIGAEPALCGCSTAVIDVGVLAERCTTLLSVLGSDYGDRIERGGGRRKVVEGSARLVADRVCYGLPEGQFRGTDCFPTR